MKSKIAVATVSGKAYYMIVNELKLRKILFLSLIPGEPIPPEIKVVITTEKEAVRVSHSNILIYNEDADPIAIVDEALRIAHGVRNYEKLVVGIDPGERFGMVLFGDGKLLETFVCSSFDETVNTLIEMLKRIPAETVTVKIGDGAPVFMRELIRLLDLRLPKKVILMRVSEVGTSRLVRGEVHRRGLTDVMSAIKIAGREGQIIPREVMK
jgi:hypothetical protein